MEMHRSRIREIESNWSGAWPQSLEGKAGMERMANMQRGLVESNHLKQ